jgi:hypothetical protein
MDEAGIALGICTNSMVLGDSRKKRTYVRSPQNREWVSVVETISAAGRSIRPIIIFKGKNLQTTWFQHDKVSTRYLKTFMRPVSVTEDVSR